MTTLLEMYETYHNGNHKEFCEQVNAYGAACFAKDTGVEIADGVLNTAEAYGMLRTYIMLTGWEL